MNPKAGPSRVILENANVKKGIKRPSKESVSVHKENTSKKPWQGNRSNTAKKRPNNAAMFAVKRPCDTDPSHAIVVTTKGMKSPFPHWIIGTYPADVHSSKTHVLNKYQDLSCYSPIFIFVKKTW